MTSERAVSRAESLYHTGDYEGVVELLVPWLNETPGDARAWQVLGAAQFELGLYEFAEESTATVVALQPDSAVAYANWGTVLRKLGRYAEARSAQHGALRLAPGHQRACVELRKIEDAESGTGRPTTSTGGAGFELAEFEDYAAEEEPYLGDAPASEEPPSDVIDPDEGYCQECGAIVAPGRSLCSDCIAAAATMPAPMPEPEPVAVTAPIPTRSTKPKVDRTLTIGGAIIGVILIVGVVYAYGLPRWFSPRPVEVVAPPPRAPRPTPTPPAATPAASQSTGEVVVEWAEDPTLARDLAEVKTRPGFRMVACLVIIQNGAQVPVSISLRHCELKSKQSGASYSYKDVGLTDQLPSVDLGPGDRAMGRVAFEVAGTDTRFSFEYDPPALLQKYTIRVVDQNGPSASTPGS